MRKEIYPTYLKTKDALMAFMSKDKMVMITNQGRNQNPGVCIDYFITRKMVLKHYGRQGETITKEAFERLYNQIFESVKTFIL